MWNFFYKMIFSLSGLYLCFTIIFSYELLISEVPDNIYITKGEDANINVEFPLVMIDDRICSLFGIIPIKEVSISEVEEQTVYPCGKIIGLYTETEGVFVIDTCEIESQKGESINPSKGKIQTGDYIVAIDGEALKSKEDMVKMVSESEGETMSFSIIRDGTDKEISLTPIKSKIGTYLLGIWVKDDQAGVGTMTYFTDTGKFGALGHGMGNGEDGELLCIDSGEIYNSKILGIEKGKKGTPGEVKGAIYYGSGNHLGELNSNCSVGMFGEIDLDDYKDYVLEMDSYEVAHKQEIKKGKAQIISEVSGELEYYDIEITYIDYLSMDNNKGLHVEITDPKLLELTGGIVQGMSGSPIIQNGKLVGAVTHVLVNDPTRGYGIFIEDMLKQ